MGNAITDFGEGGSEGDEDLEDDDEETGSTKITVANECYSRFAEKEEILQSNPTDTRNAHSTLVIESQCASSLGCCVFAGMDCRSV